MRARIRQPWPARTDPSAGLERLTDGTLDHNPQDPAMKLLLAFAILSAAPYAGSGNEQTVLRESRGRIIGTATTGKCGRSPSRSASLRVFLPINDQQPVSLKGTQTCLQGSKHRHRDIGGETFLERACNQTALVDHTLRALGDEPISLG
jgi:hypothetical protein